MPQLAFRLHDTCLEKSDCAYAIKGCGSQHEKLTKSCSTPRRFFSVLFFVGFFLANLFVRHVDCFPSSENLCLKPTCLNFAVQVLKSRNASADTCVDFYEYSCGKFHENNPLGPNDILNASRVQLRVNNLKFFFSLLDDRNHLMSDDEDQVYLYDLLQDFMRACTDTETLESTSLVATKREAMKMRSFFSEEKKNMTNESLVDALAMSFGLGSNLLFWMNAVTNIFEPAKQAILLEPGTLSLKFREHYNSSEYRDLLLQTINVTLEKVLGPAPSNIVSWESVAKSVIELEAKLASIQSEVTVFDDPIDAVEKLLFDAAKKLFSTFDLQSLFDNLLKTYTNDLKKRIDWNTVDVLVTDMPYFVALDKLLRKESLSTMLWYFTWHTIQKMLLWDSPSAADMVKKLHVSLNTWKFGLGRQTMCYFEVEKALGFALSHFFIEKKFSKESLAGATKIASNIISSFRARLSSADWLDEETRTEAALKLDNINLSIGYPSFVSSAKALKKYYSDYNPINKSYAEVQKASHKRNINRMFKKLSKPSDRSHWARYPHTVDAGYRHRENSIEFPAGILQFPFYSPDFPDAVNYGSIGAGIGHEISHAFDLNGRKFDASGKRRMWWTNETNNRYHDRIGCFENLYNGYSVPGPNSTRLKVDGKLTLNENIADQMGLEASFAAMQASKGSVKNLPGLSNYTEEQLFMISYAQLFCSVIDPGYQKQLILYNLHSPDSAPINGFSHNSFAFANAFECKKPVAPCHLW